MTDKEKQQQAIAILENLMSNLDTTALVMRKLGSPYSDKSSELAGAREMVQEWVAEIQKEKKQ